MASQKHQQKARTVATAALLIPAVIQAFPLFYVLALSFKSAPEIFQYPPPLLPKSLDLANYLEALKAAPLVRFLFNSLIVSSAITVMQVITSILAAFALARIDFRGKKFAMALILLTMMIPGEVTIIPNYFTVSKLNWLDTYWSLIAPFSASGFGVFLLYQFFRTIPKELEEAATMDGASRLRFLFQFMVPLSTPAILAFSIYSFVNAWNLYLWPLVVTQSTQMQTAQIGIGMFRAQNESLHWGVIMAATVLLVAPSIALFIATQRHFVRGITVTGLKG